MTWSEICRAYPDEWVAVVDYKREGPVEVSGIVVGHAGELIQESDLP